MELKAAATIPMEEGIGSVQIDLVRYLAAPLRSGNDHQASGDRLRRCDANDPYLSIQVAQVGRDGNRECHHQ